MKGPLPFQPIPTPPRGPSRRVLFYFRPPHFTSSYGVNQSKKQTPPYTSVPVGPHSRIPTLVYNHYSPSLGSSTLGSSLTVVHHRRTVYMCQFSPSIHGPVTGSSIPMALVHPAILGSSVVSPPLCRPHPGSVLH